MKKTIYLIKKEVIEDNSEKLTEVSGEEFYRFVDSLDGNKRYFIRLIDDVFYEGAEIVIEANLAEYQEWRKEYDKHRYVEQASQGFTQLPLEELLSEQRILAGELTEENLPEIVLSKKEDYQNLSRALKSLAPKEKQLIDMLYLREPPLTMRQAAEFFGVSPSTVHKRKEKIIEKMRKFW